MKVTVDSKKGLKTKLKVFIDKKTVQERIEVRLLELSKTINLKGFRPGKVPTNVLKSQFGKAIYGEILEKILKETSEKAIEEKKIKVAGHPKLDLKSYGEDKDIQYNIEIDELPSIKVKPLDNITFTTYEINITDDETKKRIDEIAKNQNNFKERDENESAKKGDLISFDYTATIDKKDFEGNKGKNTQIIIGKDLFIKGFDNQLIDSKKNQEKNVIATLPENYPKKEFANRKASFLCKILSIKKPEEIKIDDQFAKNLGAKDFKDLKVLVTKQMQNQYKASLDDLTKNEIMNQIEKSYNFDLPDNLVQNELEVISKGLKKEDVEKNKKESEKIARKRIKLGLILNEFGESNNLKVEEIEMRKEIEKQVQSMPGQQKQILEYYQQNPSASATLRGSIYEDKIINLIKQKSKEVKKTISTKEAESILNNNLKVDEKTKSTNQKKKSINPKKTTKTSKIKKKIRKK